jgi:hypothetical protein
VKYIQVSSGEHNSYFLRDDGAVDRTTGGGVVSTFDAPENTKYTAVSIGTSASYLLRADGSVDRSPGSGQIKSTLAPPEGTTYVSVTGGQVTTMPKKNPTFLTCLSDTQEVSYLVRSDGAVDKTSSGEIKVCISRL